MLARRRSTSKGFTFLEIMFVVVIIGILLALVGPRLVGRAQGARIAAAQAQINNFSNALKQHELDIGSFPKNFDDLEAEESDEKGWNGPYMDSIPEDPWGQAYVYKYPGTNNKKGFDLMSLGPDKQENTEDDIPNWNKKR